MMFHRTAYVRCSTIFRFLFQPIPKFRKTIKTIFLQVVPQISVNDTREKIAEKILGSAGKSEIALITLYVYRQMDKISWLPFVKAAIERNPVCFNELNGKSIQEVVEILDHVA